MDKPVINRLGVEARSFKIEIQQWDQELSAREALELAAWLVATVDDEEQFTEILSLVREEIEGSDDD